MKKLLSTIFSILLILLIVGVVIFPKPVEAGWFADLACLFSGGCGVSEAVGTVFLNSLAAGIGYLALTISSWFLSLSGIVLNISIILTMNIKTIYESSPAIGEIWVVIRNISSMFIIFGLIYTSILTILDTDMGKFNVRSLIINIIMAGLLINFSLFFTKTLVDASNLISTQFYRAIAPESKGINLSTSDLKSIVSNTWTSGGLADIFMQSLKLPSVYNNPKGFITGVIEQDFFHITISTIAGSVLMILAALSFFAAAVAFIVRIVVLLLLMGFSPIYFVGWIFPTIKNNLSDKWEGWFRSQLIFMPVYLLLMYVAMKFIGGDGFFSSLDSSRLASGTGPGGVLLSTVGLLLQFTIAFILINIPLMAALRLGGLSAKWGESAKKWVNDKIRGSIGFAGQNSIGRRAKVIQEKIASSGFASRNPNMAILANKAISGIPGASFGGSKGGFEKRNKDYIKEKVEFGNKLKLSDKYKKDYVDYHTSTWENKDRDLEKDLIKAESDSINPAITEDGRQQAIKKAAQLKVEIEARNKARGAGNKSKYLETEALKVKKEEYAQNLEKGRDFFTTKARKEAARAIRDEMNKSEDKKIEDKIKKIIAASEEEPKTEKSDDSKK